MNFDELKQRAEVFCATVKSEMDDPFVSPITMKRDGDTDCAIVTVGQSDLAFWPAAGDGLHVALHDPEEDGPIDLDIEDNEVAIKGLASDMVVAGHF